MIRFPRRITPRDLPGRSLAHAKVEGPPPCLPSLSSSRGSTGLLPAACRPLPRATGLCAAAAQPPPTDSAMALLRRHRSTLPTACRHGVSSRRRRAAASAAEGACCKATAGSDPRPAPHLPRTRPPWDPLPRPRAHPQPWPPASFCRRSLLQGHRRPLLNSWRSLTIAGGPTARGYQRCYQRWTALLSWMYGVATDGRCLFLPWVYTVATDGRRLCYLGSTMLLP